DNSFGSASDNKIHLPPAAPAHAGVLRLEGANISLGPPVGGFPETLLVDGKPATARNLPVDPNSDKTNPRLTIASLTMYVIRRGERYALRIKEDRKSVV